jgi:NAD(P)-dependent dehydrogenase (short-subunit alcohol dehydrogenase family)
MQIDLSGKVALVTGGNSGLGEGIARGLAASGAKVAVNYVTHPETAEALVGSLKAKGGQAVAVLADVSDPAAVAAMFGQVDQQLGPVDILVNNAGIDGGRQLAWESDIGSWQRVISINLVGPYLCAREALQRMVGRKSGVIVNITSVHERIAWSGYSAYTASKAGVSMLTQTLAQEAAPYGVRVVAVAPGAIRTPINQNVWSDPAGLKDLLTKIPLGRIGEVEDIAQMVVFLASDQASYVTATTVYVDGGMTDYPDFSHGG